MKQLSISARLGLMFGLSVLALLAVGLWGLRVSNLNADNARRIYDEGLQSVYVMSEARKTFLDTRIQVYRHVLNKTEEEKRATEEKVRTREAEIKKYFEDYIPLISNEDDKHIWETNKAKLVKYFALIHNSILPLSYANETEQALDLIGQEVLPVAREIAGQFDEHVELNATLSADLKKLTLDEAARGQWMILGMIAVALLSIGSLGWALTQDVKKRLQVLDDTVGHISKNLDFTQRCPVGRQDELGRVMSRFNSLVERVQSSLRAVMHSTQALAGASTQLTATSQQVATSATEQSNAAADIAATVEELSVSVDHLGAQAGEASQLAEESGALASEGETIIGQTTRDIQSIASLVRDASGLMNNLEEQSNEVSNVLNVIKELAQQTNLLALNAAIEAARAGEQGRGFAVVADEVRKLAERTATSTQEIEGTIGTMRSSANSANSSMRQIVDQVSQGVDRANQTTEAIQRIAQGSKRSVSTVVEISGAIQEQGQAASNIAVKVEKIAQMSEESSVAAQECAQAARTLDQLANQLQNVTREYRL